MYKPVANTLTQDTEKDMQTIYELLKFAVNEYGDRLTVNFRNVDYSWNQIDALSDVIALRLEKAGVKKSDHVGIMDYNSLNWLIIFFAIAKIGAVSVLLNVKYTERELVQALEISDTKVVYVGNIVMKKNPERFVMAESEPDVNILSEAQLFAGIDDNRKHNGYSSCEVRGKDICSFIFTSGSTQKPKCVMLSNESLVKNAEALADKMEFRKHDIVCPSTPFFHIFSLCSSFLSVLFTGSKLVIPESINSLGLLNCVKKNGCTVLNGVPTSLLALISKDEFSEENVKTLRLSMMGGAKITKSQMSELMKKIPHVSFMVNYGTTEAGFVCNTDFGDTLCTISTTVGRPMHHAEVKIADLKTGESVSVNENGEILVKGIGIMSGYYKGGNEMVDENGYLHTGDIGFVDEDGRINVLQRKNSIIIRGGENISPAEIEKVIESYDAVNEAIVLGIPDKVLGEEVAAFIETNSQMEFNENELRRIMQKNLAKFKIPSKMIVMEKFPLMANGKIDMQALKKMTNKNSSLE